MPLVGYSEYNYNDRVTRVLGAYMRVPAEVYFSYATPAIAGFCFALNLPLYKTFVADEGITFSRNIQRCKDLLTKDSHLGMVFIILGLLSFFVNKFLPASLQYFGIVLFFCSFSGLLYIYFTPNLNNKKIIIYLFIAFLIGNAISLGMFTIVAYMGITIFSFFFLGKRTSLFKKAMVLVTAMFLLLVIQNTKTTFRKFVWQKEEYQGSKLALFTNIFVDNLQKGDELFEKKAFFPIYWRTNQGFNISMVMHRIPAVKPFDNGKVLSTSLLSSLVPRFLWPDKPTAGGLFNMEYYAGWKIKSWSTNIGPLGEAYGSFGVAGGILYMFLLGFFIRFAYKKVFSLSAKIPLLVLWIPFLFYEITYSMETDSLQIFNSLLKSAFFMWLIYKYVPRFFLIKRNPEHPKPVLRPTTV
jgi:hypothetical protein